MPVRTIAPGQWGRSHNGPLAVMFVVIYCANMIVGSHQPNATNTTLICSAPTDPHSSFTTSSMPTSDICDNPNSKVIPPTLLPTNNITKKIPNQKRTGSCSHSPFDNLSRAFVINAADPTVFYLQSDQHNSCDLSSEVAASTTQNTTNSYISNFVPTSCKTPRFTDALSASEQEEKLKDFLNHTTDIVPRISDARVRYAVPNISRWTWLLLYSMVFLP